MREGDHHWTVEEDLVTFYCARYETHYLGTSEADLAAQLDLPIGTFRMRIANFKALDGNGRLSNAAKQSQLVHKLFGEMLEKELRQWVSDILARSKTLTD
jgi:hypothetical protein